jgi:hypothetical protein
VSAQDSSGNILTGSTPITFVSSNTAVVEIAASGLACAGKWDSLANPTICTPGPVGTAVITALSQGVSSPPTTVRTHQHIDQIVVTPVPNQTPLAPPLPSNVCGQPIPAFSFCLSKGGTYLYQANACRGGADITSTVGPFTWQSLNLGIGNVIESTANRALGRVMVTASNPGRTQIYATNSGTTSTTQEFTTCPVKSISLAISNAAGNSFSVTSGGATIIATVLDSTNTEIKGVPLTWSTSDAAAFSVGGGAASSIRPGSATLIASCTLPLCNAGFPSPLLIYPQTAITGTGTGTGTAPPSSTLWLASSQCNLAGVHSDDCVSTLSAFNSGDHTPVALADLTALPNSLIFNRQSSRAFLGTDSGLLGTAGLAVLTPGSNGNGPTLGSLLSAPGKVLAVSPDGQKVVVADTADTPNQAFIVNLTSATPAVTPLPITGATAADFAPDSFKAFIVAGSNLYVYSPVEPLKKIALGGPAADVTFLSNGAFAYLAGGSASKQVSVRKTCDNDVARAADNSLQDVSLPLAPKFIKTLPDSSGVLAINSTGVNMIQVASAPVDCQPTDQTAIPPVPGLPNVVNGAVASFNFGLGSFTPKQLIIASSQRAYVVTDQSPIVEFNIPTQTTTLLQLSGNTLPVRAALSVDGTRLFVIGRDPVTQVNSVHVLDTVNNIDIDQILMPQPACHSKSGATNPFTCDIDLITVQP